MRNYLFIERMLENERPFSRIGRPFFKNERLNLKNGSPFFGLRLSLSIFGKSVAGLNLKHKLFLCF